MKPVYNKLHVLWGYEKGLSCKRRLAGENAIIEVV